MMKTSGELQELITTLYIGFLGLIFSSYFVYLSEKEASLLKKKFRKPVPCTLRKMDRKAQEKVIFEPFEYYLSA
jgi:hypothetical protein